ncbi:MAG: hypothetical protein WCI04_07080 [archaeon]
MNLKPYIQLAISVAVIGVSGTLIVYGIKKYRDSRKKTSGFEGISTNSQFKNPFTKSHEGLGECRVYELGQFEKKEVKTLPNYQECVPLEIRILDEEKYCKISEKNEWILEKDLQLPSNK